MTRLIKSAEIGRITNAINVIRGLIVSIIINTPIIVVTDVINIVTLWFRLCPNVSTSLVIRDNTSPTVRDSKYFIGIRSIFSDISFRKRKQSFCVTPVMIHPWIKEKTALTKYIVSRINRIFPILSKSMPPVPLIFATKPLNSSVVALLKIFGPMILKIVLPIANTMTVATANLYFPI